MIRSPGSVKVTWASLAGKPATFPPAAHTHAIADVTGLQSALDGKQASGSYVTTANFTWGNLSGKPTTFTPTAHTHLWTDITDKPTTFAPSSHTHAISEVTGLQGALDGKQASGSYVTSANFTWANLSGKPTTFPPSAHTHLWADITDKPTTFTPATHTHAGLLTLVGTATVGETTLISLSLGVKRYSVTMAGLAVGDRVIAVLTGAPGASSLQDVYVSGANTLNVGLLNPALGIGAVISVGIAVYRIT